MATLDWSNILQQAYNIESTFHILHQICLKYEVYNTHSQEYTCHLGNTSDGIFLLQNSEYRTS